MSGRATVIAALAILAACQPDGPAEREVCGWRCDPMNECPNGYACYADGRCHVAGTSQTRGCTLDGGLAEMPPSIASAEPGDDQTEVPTDIAIRIKFDKPVHGVDGSTFTVRRESVFDPIAATVTYDERERVATLTPQNTLDVGAYYIVTVAASITDENGHPYAGRSWRFSTVRDVTPPRLTTIRPLPGATSVGIEDPLIATFSEPVWGVASDAFTIRGPDGQLASNITYVSSQLSRANGPWAPNTKYTVTITPDFVDFAGNPLAGAPFVWSFTTGPDTVPPRIELQMPHPGATEVSTQLAVTVGFSEPVIGYASSIYVDLAGTRVPAATIYNAARKEVRMVPNPPLKPDTEYRVVIEPGLTDLSGNPVAPGVLSWPFHTAVAP